MKKSPACPTSNQENFAPDPCLDKPSPSGICAVRTRMKEYCAVLVLCAATTLASASVTFKALVSFHGTNGSDPTNVDLVQGIDGELYGTTQFGGATNNGTVFKINSGGTLRTLWSFCKVSGCPDGDRPVTGLTVVPGGDLYGTTYGGGAHGGGTIFKITPAGALTTVHSFCGSFGCADGLNPEASLFLAADGNLYGTTLLGGTGGCGGCHGGGTAFRISLSGSFAKIHDFCTGTCTDYGNPSNALMQASDGNFYGEISGIWVLRRQCLPHDSSRKSNFALHVLQTHRLHRRCLSRRWVGSGRQWQPLRNHCRRREI